MNNSGNIFLPLLALTMLFLFVSFSDAMAENAFTNQDLTTQVSDSLIQTSDAQLIADGSNEKVGFIRRVTNWYMDNINYFTITLLMTIESSFIPFPSEVVLPPAAWKAAQGGELNVFLIFVFGTFGALLGALVNYFLSISLGRAIIYRLADTKIAHLLLINREKIENAEQYFVKNGKVSTLIGRLVPGIRQLISIPAGLAKMNLSVFLIFTAIGAGIWNVILIALGWFLYAQQELLTEVYHNIKVVLLIVGVLFVAYLILKKFVFKKKQAAK